MGASIVRLTRGIAHRTPDGFRFICPEAWGGDVTAPAAAIPGGPAVVASEALTLIEPDGRVSLHPDAVGRGIALANNGDSLFGLFQRGGQRELRRIRADGSELLGTLDEPYAALAASDHELALLGWTGATLFVRRASLSGELGERTTWSLAAPVDYAELRIMADEIYVSIWGTSAPWVSVGRWTPDGYQRVRDANANVTGPIGLGDGAALLRDGKLETLSDHRPLSGPDDHVTCLASELGLPYACAGGALRRVDEDGLGTPLFELTDLREPDYDALPEVARADCQTRWLDLRVDTLPPGASADALDVVPDVGDPSARGSDGALDSGEEVADSGGGSSCSLQLSPNHAGWPGTLALSALGVHLARRRSRPRDRRRPSV